MKDKTKKILFGTFAILAMLIGLLIITSPEFLTTVYTPVNGTFPETMQQCQDIGGIAIPKNLECPQEFVEIGGNAGKSYLCCLEDTCEGTWTRQYNDDKEVFEKVCTS